MNKYLTALAIALLASCSTDRTPGLSSIKDGAPVEIPVDIDAIPDAVPRFEPRTSAGNPESYEVMGKMYTVQKSSKGYLKQGIASWYGTKFHGQRTSNGEPYDMFAMSAAHKTLPIPTYVRVTNLSNKRSIVVRINDRGPFHDNRIIDLSYVAAAKLGIAQAGTGFVEVRALEPGQPQNFDDSENISSGRNIYLQIGAFSDRNNALKLKNKLTINRLPEARIKPYSGNDMTLYKVQLGPLFSAEDADQLSEKLAAIGITQTRYVAETEQN